MTMSEIQNKIADYLDWDSSAGVALKPGEFRAESLLCFVGMIETGEATYADFEAVGGVVLAAAVAIQPMGIDEYGRVKN